MKKNSLFHLITILVLNFSCSRSQMTPEEADRSMKILNGNLVNLISTGSEKPEYKALAFLFEQVSTPLPFVKRANPTDLDTAVYRIGEKRGNYEWNATTRTFKKNSNSEIVIIHFPLEKSETNNTVFSLKKYKSQPYSSRPDFPVEVEAILNSGNQQVLSVNHRATIDNNLPEEIFSQIDGTDYQLGLGLKRTREGKLGKLRLDIWMKTKGIKVISGKVDADIEYSRRSYFFKYITFRLKLIDHTVDGIINYSAIDPTSADYINSFNSNSKIIIREGQNEVGKVILNKMNNSELLDYFVCFSNDRKILLTEYIPLLKKVLNLKY